MSTAFAIAAVSACVRELIHNHLSAAGIGSLVGGNVKVSTRPPDRVLGSGAEDPTQVNWFLHRVAPNAGWSNRHLPARDRSGARVDSPPLALNLHYALTVFASRELHAEILLGHAMQALHDTPQLGRDAIRGSLSPAVPPADWPAPLALSGLGDQIEAIKFTLIPSPEEVGRIWSAINSHYRTTAFYEVSVVLIDPVLSSRPALPVTRPLLYLETLDRPRLDLVADAADAARPITLASTLRLSGQDLRGDDTRVMLGHLDLSSPATVVGVREILQPLAPPPPGLRAGLHPVRVLHRRLLGDPPAPHAGVESNVVGVVVHPDLAPGAVAIGSTRVVDGVTYKTGSVSVTLAPSVDARQRVFLLLNEKNPPPSRPPRGYRLPAPEANGIVAPATETAALAFPFVDIAAGAYLARVSVDGAESLLGVDGSGRFATPQIVV